MALPDRQLVPSKMAQQSLVKMVNQFIDTDNSIDQMRSIFLTRDMEYFREQDKTEQNNRAKAANWSGDATKMQNPTVPVVAPQVETSLAYFTEVFLSSYPVFPVVAGPKLQGAALEIETVLGESAVHFRWVPELAKALRDGLKYNLMAVECEWKKDKVFSVENKPAENMTLGIPVETVFEGSKLKRLDPYNLILDKRVPPSEIHTKGDYAGYSELVTRLQLKQMLADLDSSMTMNAKEAFETPTTAGGTRAYYFPQITSAVFADPAVRPGTTNWMQWAKMETAKQINYQDMYEVTILYARVIPKEVGIEGPKSGTPQIYKIILVNRQTIIYLERKTNAHNFLPIVVGQIVDDGLGYQTKSLAENSAPYQQIATSLWTSAMASQRRKVYDRLFYDPSKINKRDIDNVDPVARIPVKTEAYGKPISDAVYSIPYRDDTVPVVLSMAQQVVEMANVSFGQNRVSQGQFQKGNKTRFEVNEVMTAADARPRMYAVLLEASWFQPIKHILKSNILQYQPPTKLYNRQTQAAVQVSPEELRKTIWQFKIADGILPSDRLINMESMNYALQLGMTQPMIGAEYDILGIFFYQMQLQGATWIEEFRRTPAQKAEMQQQMMAQQAAGTPPNGQ